MRNRPIDDWHDYDDWDNYDDLYDANDLDDIFDNLEDLDNDYDNYDYADDALHDYDDFDTHDPYETDHRIKEIEKKAHRDFKATVEVYFQRRWYRGRSHKAKKIRACNQRARITDQLDVPEYESAWEMLAAFYAEYEEVYHVYP
jgi:hypothetical protein